MEPNHVYVIPPNKNMSIRQGCLRLTSRIGELCFATAHRRVLYRVGGGAGEHGHRRCPFWHGIGRHVRAEGIKAAGGITLAQDPKTAQWPAMPLSAMTAGSVDFILSPKRIAAELTRTSRHTYLAGASEVPEGSDLDRLCLILRSSTGIDFRLYKQATVLRRIARRMALQKIASLSKYAQNLKQNPEGRRPWRMTSSFM